MKEMLELKLYGWADAIIFIDNCDKEHIYQSFVAKSVDLTYSQTNRIINSLAYHKFITFSKIGRIKSIKMTDEGKKVAYSLKVIKGCINGEN